MHPLLDDVIRTDGSVASLAALTGALRAAGGPLREQRDEHTWAVTFVWIGEAPSVSVQCGLVDHRGLGTPLERVGRSAVWALSCDAPHDTLVSYRFVLDDPFLGADALDDATWQRLMLEAQLRSFADPHNPARIAPVAALFGLDPPPEQWESMLALPGAPDTHWFDAHQAPAGVVEEFTLESAAMGSSRTISVYVPAAAPPVGGHPLVVLLDGPAFAELGGLPRALDLAVHERFVRPVVVAFVHEASTSHGFDDRTRELSCNAAHARMLVEELLPALRRDFPVDPSPAATVLGGASLGGLASTFTAMEHAPAIGNVLSVSGSYWYGTERDGLPEWIARRMATEPLHPFRLYQQIGTFEDAPLPLSPGVSHLVANRHLRDVALAKGHEVHYHETATAHDVVAFRMAALHGLRALLPGASV